MDDRILLAHGSGGKMSHDLVNRCIRGVLSNPILDIMDDSAVFGLTGTLAFTTDSFVVSPIFFPGGDIGKLSVCGTVNDLSMAGAVPLYLSLAFILEEGFSQTDLTRIVESIGKAADEAGVKVVTGDTKVVGKGSCDRIFINTAGIGRVPEGVDISGENAKPGDKVILSGSIGDHGIAIMSKREGLSFETELKSDCAPLNKLVSDMLAVSRDIHCLRDPTRGGLATTLNEIALQSKVGIRLEENKIPVKDEVRGACEMLGLDPLYIANEGKLVAIVPEAIANNIVAAMRKNVYGKDSSIIGEVTGEHPRRVVMRTSFGTSRIIDMLTGEALPRIC